MGNNKPVAFAFAVGATVGLLILLEEVVGWTSIAVHAVTWSLITAGYISWITARRRRDK